MIVSWPCGDGWFKHRSDFCVSEGHFSRVFPMTAGGWSEQNIATIATILATSCHICRFHRYCCLNAVKILTLAVIWQTLFSPLPTLKTCKPVSTTTAATIVGPRDSARDHTWNNETLEVLSFQSPIFFQMFIKPCRFSPHFRRDAMDDVTWQQLLRSCAEELGDDVAEPPESCWTERWTKCRLRMIKIGWEWLRITNNKYTKTLATWVWYNFSFGYSSTEWCRK